MFCYEIGSSQDFGIDKIIQKIFSMYNSNIGTYLSIYLSIYVVTPISKYTQSNFFILSYCGGAENMLTVSSADR